MRPNPVATARGTDLMAISDLKVED